MKTQILSLSVLGLIVAPFMSLRAQNEEDSKTVKINIEVTKDGETETIVKEFTVPEGVDFNWNFEEGGSDEHKVIIRKQVNGTDDIRLSGDHKEQPIAFLGIMGYTMNKNGGGDKHVRITEAIEGEPAAKAGLMNEDIIESIDGTAINTYPELIDLLRTKKPGDVVEVKVKREGKLKSFKVTLGERKAKSMMMMRNFSNMEDMEWHMGEARQLSEEENAIIAEAAGINPSKSAYQGNVTMEIFPNPSSDKVSYSLKLEKGGSLTRMLLNETGKVLESHDYKSEDGTYKGEVNLEELPAGNYFLVFKQGDKLISEKLVKK